jgi:two-component system NtrC family response regulator
LAFNADSASHIAERCFRCLADRTAPSKAAVLITGESGTGKELMIHYASLRKNKPLVAVNCAALAGNLLESELFGHAKGAFTDAERQHKAHFEMANNGTLFSDEVGEIPRPPR